MNERSTCPDCGAPLAANSPRGLCPRCLFALGQTPMPDTQHDSNSPPTPDPFDGATRFGDYDLLEELGRGGMGVVYKARQRSLGRLVALKLLSFGPLAGRESIRRFRAEAAAAGALHHPNIVGVHEVGLHEGQHFIVMDYVDGPSLAGLIRGEPMPARRAAGYLRTIAEAIHYAHRQGILHRDLKPSNILVGSDDRPRIADFGLARRLDADSSLTLTGQTLGTPNYMPPEQYQAGAGIMTETRPSGSASPADEQPLPTSDGERKSNKPTVSYPSDVWALGAILYYLVTGRPPFQAGSPAETMNLTLNADPVAPRLLNPSVPPGVETICLKCLEKAPAQRYATAKALVDDLERFLNDEPIQARPFTRTDHAWRWCRRKPALAASLFFILILLSIVIIGSPIAVYRIDQARKAEGAERQRAEALREAAQAQAYTSAMNLAKQEWDNGNLVRARELLEAHIPKPGERDLRGFEWRYLWQLCQEESQSTNALRNDNVKQLLTTPAHSFVAACCENSVRLLDPATGRELERLDYPNPEATNIFPVMALAAGVTNLLAAHRAEGLVTIWDLTKHERLMTFRAFTNNVGTLALSSDGRYLAAADRTRLYSTAISLWDIPPRPQSPRLVWSNATTDALSTLAFSPDGQFLVAAAGHSEIGVRISVLEAASGRESRSISNASVGSVEAMAFSRDGALLATSGIESRIRVWDFASRTLKMFLDGNREFVTSLSFSPDGSKLITGAWDGTIRRWDLDSNQAPGIWRDRPNRGLYVAFAPDSKSIISAAGDSVKVWKPEPREPATIIETQEGWGVPIISPDRKWMIVAWAVEVSGPRVAAVWDLESGRRKFVLPFRGRSPLGMAFSPDGQLFALGDLDKEGLVGLWQWRSWGQASAEPRPFAYLTNGFEAGSVAFSPDGKILAVAGLSFPPNDPVVPSGATNRLAFWQVGSWNKLNLLPEAGIGRTEWAAAGTAAFSQNGRWLATGHRDGWVRLWDFKQRRLAKEFELHSTRGWSVDVRFSGDDRWLAAFVIGGSSVALFDLTDLERPPVFLTRDDPSGAFKAEFSPDSRTLVTGHRNGEIKLWSLRSLALALSLPNGHGPGAFPAFAPDGNLLVSKTAQGTVRLWHAAPLNGIPKFQTTENHRR